MDTGKVPLGTEVYLAVLNPLYGKDKCKCCGHKLKKQPRYIYAEGYFVGIQLEDDDLLHMCEYTDPTDNGYKVEPVGRHWMGDIIDSGEEFFGNDEPDDFDYYSKDIDIFEYGYEWDGNMVFPTEKAAKEWIKEFGEEE